MIISPGGCFCARPCSAGGCPDQPLQSSGCLDYPLQCLGHEFHHWILLVAYTNKKAETKGGSNSPLSTRVLEHSVRKYAKGHLLCQGYTRIMKLNFKDIQDYNGPKK